jgi:two-component system, NtrC family, response regulator AtoC
MAPRTDSDCGEEAWVARDEGLGSKTAPIGDDDLAKLRAWRKTRSAQPVSLLIYHRDGLVSVPLADGQSLVIGRHPPSDVPIRDSSLSRQHACVELVDGQVWVEDLGSTNGTWVDGSRVERAAVSSESELAFGAVTATVHLSAPSELRGVGLESHDRFCAELEREVSRARSHGRGLALLLLRGDKSAAGHPSRWIASLLAGLRPYDRAALYSDSTVELLLPEVDLARGRELAEAARTAAPLRGGLGLLPDHAASSGELFEVTRRALQQASDAEPLQLAVTAQGSERAAPSSAPVVQGSAMRAVYETVRKLASSVIPVLILGETGTGKEVVARAIHRGGKRKDGPMLCINCGAIPGQLVESTLFGHEKGAFTGAGQQQKGVFEAASGGTVLLDEIGELPAATQVALLRVIEARRITRVGSTQELEVDVRLLAATHRDLDEMCRSGRFRQDLLYRLNAMTLKIPALRDRTEEIEVLARHFVEQANAANDCRITGIDETALELLRRYAWPGNVRELRNAIDRAVVIAHGEQITVEDLPEAVRALEPPRQPTGSSSEPDGEVNLQRELDRHESELILEALRATSWNRTEAARRLGLPLRTLARKMQAHGIRRVTYQQPPEK